MKLALAHVQGFVGTAVVVFLFAMILLGCATVIVGFVFVTFQCFNELALTLLALGGA